MDISDWINNGWVIGIGGGILSGLIVTAVSRRLFSGKDQREHLSKVASANREVVYAIRQGIPEDRVPSRDIVESLITATARKFGLTSEDLNRPEDVAADLVKEVMDSSFISAEKKEQYCAALLGKLSPAKTEPSNKVSDVAAFRSMADEQRTRIAWVMSITLGMTATGMSLTLAYIAKTNEGINQQWTIVLPAAIAIAAAGMGMILNQISRHRRQAMQVDQISREIFANSDESFLKAYRSIDAYPRARKRENSSTGE